ncbi:DUF6199 family natural product biosynthesis protein [Paenibacillus sp. XY044]|uniref:DUF6199 family natural product biosynthesis protein n=1 Tax=Paenibacillus sp. XY044 TaxID=2026089 RepID=UPI000B992BCA|nr:DUF6199 family natural product biosynthesis protein [Paenibacillus sp. XY044]OZB91067.1 hypothetical protein CJP46_30160 [Paenibacillus sp. XY044]
MDIVLVILGLILIGGGIMTRRNPGMGWRINESWKTEDESEPSESYLELQRVRGFLAVVLGSIFIVIGLFMLLFL